jgi:hypothetical protein
MSLIDTIKSWFSKSDDHPHDDDHPHEHDEAVSATATAAMPPGPAAGMPPEPSAAAAPAPPTAEEIGEAVPSDEE